MPQACSSMVREYGSSPAIHACTLCHNTPNVGRALITGEWSDLNRFKVPVLRGLPRRAVFPQRRLYLASRRGFLSTTGDSASASRMPS